VNKLSSKNFCLIGYPLVHSISPEIHRRLFNLSGIDAQYNLVEITPENFETNLHYLKTLDGFNVTIPHKQRILPYLSEIDPRALRYGAVNTVKGGIKLSGFNTDVEGFLRALASAKISLSGRVLLCGAGGAARMMACEALDRGCSLVVATRAIESAQSCADHLKNLYPKSDITAQLLQDVGGSFDLILNGTPVGMYPHNDGCPVAPSVVQSATAVFDAVYNPCETQLLKLARTAGAKAQGGLTMLVWQAAAAQEIWTGASFDESTIKSLCCEMEILITKKYNDNNTNFNLK
jgi:shikimate dehydrogenase